MNALTSLSGAGTEQRDLNRIHQEKTHAHLNLRPALDSPGASHRCQKSNQIMDESQAGCRSSLNIDAAELQSISKMTRWPDGGRKRKNPVLLLEIKPPKQVHWHEFAMRQTWGRRIWSTFSVCRLTVYGTCFSSGHLQGSGSRGLMMDTGYGSACSDFCFFNFNSNSRDQNPSHMTSPAATLLGT